MLADPAAAVAVVEGPDGVASAMSAGKAYVDVSTVDEATSRKIRDMVTGAGGRFLEAPVSGSKKPAIDGQLIFLTGGDKGLFDECSEAFDIMGKACTCKRIADLADGSAGVPTSWAWHANASAHMPGS